MGGRLGQTTPRKMIKALQQRGFVIVKIKGSHVILRHGTRETCIPYHNRELPRWLQMEIVSQAGLTIEEISPYL